jgi:uncharacterized protein
MSSETQVHSLPTRAPWRNVMLLIGLVLVGMSIGSFFVLAVLMIFNPDSSLESLQKFTQNPENYANGWWSMMLMQAISHVFTFSIPALVYWHFVERHHILHFLRRSLPAFAVVMASALVVPVLMPFNAWIIALNNQMTLPNALKPIEVWMRTQEDTLIRLNDFMANFTTIPQLLVAIFVMAVVPAIGEEILFRGIIQRKIFSKIHHTHLAIWLSAALFSAIHLQFYGFLPRMLLGAMFGYLYVWSSSLWIPILAHFVNNAVTVVMFFLRNKQQITLDTTQPDTSVPWFWAASSLVFAIAILFYIKKITLYNATY